MHLLEEMSIQVFSPFLNWAIRSGVLFCIGVCAFEGANTSSNLYRLVSPGKNPFLLVSQVNGITRIQS